MQAHNLIHSTVVTTKLGGVYINAYSDGAVSIMGRAREADRRTYFTTLELVPSPIVYRGKHEAHTVADFSGNAKESPIRSRRECVKRLRVGVLKRWGRTVEAAFVAAEALAAQALGVK